jgi:hypothetical protein
MKIIFNLFKKYLYSKMFIIIMILDVIKYLKRFNLIITEIVNFSINHFNTYFNLINKFNFYLNYYTRSIDS